MKTIYFVRHAKSAWNLPVSDKERGLNERGYKDAKRIAEALKQQELSIDKVFCSTAKRAEITCSIITFELGIKTSNIIYTDQLYDFDGRNIIQLIKSLPTDLQTVMFFGHNPAFTSLVNALGDQFTDNFPTCGVVGISFEINLWSSFAQGKTILKLVPKDFK